MNLLTALEMPEQTYRNAEMTVAISDVKVGDHRGGRKVATVKTGPKNTELLDADGKRIDYFPNSTGVLIVRAVADEDMAARRRRIGQHNRILEALENRDAPVERAQEAFNAYLAQYGVVEPGRLGNLLEVTAERKLWNQLAVTAERVASPDYKGDFAGGDLVDLVNRFADQLREELLQGFRFRALSRSTGVLHNVVEDVDREARVQFLEQLRWYC